MGLTNIVYPNFLGGISQQAPELRAINQLSDVSNMIPHQVRGLEVRNPTEHFYQYGNYAGSRPLFYTHKRVSGDVSHLLITRENDTTDIKIIDNTGNVSTLYRDEEVISHYLDSENPAEDYQAVSVGDHIYVVNKTKTVLMSDDITPDRLPEGIIAFKMSNYSTTYTVTVSKGYDSKTVSFTTMSSTQPDEVWAALAERTTGIGYLLTYINAKFNGSTTPAEPDTGWDLSPVGLPANMACQIEGSTIYFYNINGDTTDFTLTATDSAAGEHLKAFKDTTDKYEELPSETHNGFELRIIGAKSSDKDDYYVRSYGTYWKETLAQGSQYKFDPLTLPAQFALDNSGEWTMSHMSMADMVVGDTTTNPVPGFVGEQIRQIVGIFKERLIIVSKSSVIMSRVSTYGEYDFFRSTILTVLDTDPISLDLNSVNRSAVPFANSLLCFGDDGVQSKVVSSGALSPSSVTVADTSAFGTGNALPVAAGKVALFSLTKGMYGQLYEFVSDVSTTAYVNTLDETVETTAHVPSLIDGDIMDILLDVNNGLGFITTENALAAGKLYVYKYLWQDGKKVISAWVYWDFNYSVVQTQIYGVQAANDSLFFLFMREGRMTIETMNLNYDSAEIDCGYKIHLDRRVKLTSSATLPYTTEEPITYVTGDGTMVNKVHAQELLTSGNPIWAGVNYTSYFVLSPASIKDANGSAYITGKLQCKTITLAYKDSGYFRLVKNGKDGKEFNGRYLDALFNTVDSMPILTGKLRFSITGKPEKMTVKFMNDTHLHWAITHAELEGYFTIRSQRM